MSDDEGLPPLPETSVVVVKGRKAPQPVTVALVEAIRSSFRID